MSDSELLIIKLQTTMLLEKFTLFHFCLILPFCEFTIYDVFASIEIFSEKKMQNSISCIVFKNNPVKHPHHSKNVIS